MCKFTNRYISAMLLRQIKELKFFNSTYKVNKYWSFKWNALKYIARIYVPKHANNHISITYRALNCLTPYLLSLFVHYLLISRSHLLLLIFWLKTNALVNFKKTSSPTVDLVRVLLFRHPYYKHSYFILYPARLNVLLLLLIIIVYLKIVCDISDITEISKFLTRRFIYIYLCVCVCVNLN
jgi:hypothetical protein